MSSRPHSQLAPAGFALGLLSVALCLAAAELFVRLFDIGPTIQVIFEESYQLSSNPVLQYELRPGASTGLIQINSAGFRDREFARRKSSDSYRIAAIGDSVTFGLWLPADAAYPKQLERLLNEHVSAPRRFEVLNFGVSGYNIAQAVERLRELALDYDPDLILYGYVLNDPQAESLEGETLLALRRLEEDRLREELARGTRRLLARSRLFTLGWLVLRQRTRALASYARDDDSSGRLHDQTRGIALTLRAPNDPGRAAYDRGDLRGEYFRSLYTSQSSRRRFTAGLDDLARLAARAGIPVVVAIFPIFFDVSSNTYPLRDVHEEVRRAALARGLSVVDLLPAFATAERRFGATRPVAADFLHPSAFGQRVAAVELARWLWRSELNDSTLARARAQ